MQYYPLSDVIFCRRNNITMLFSMFGDHNTNIKRNLRQLRIQYQLQSSGEASPTFGHANANFSVFVDRIRNQFLKK